MASNEDLAVAFLCLAGKSEKDTILNLIKDRSKIWNDEFNNLSRLIEAIELPTSQISKKINYLHSALINCPFKKAIYEEMANSIAILSTSARSPIFKTRNENEYCPANDHILTFKLNSKSGTQ